MIRATAARVGIQDVARAAGVSATTVSHALNGRGKVSATTRAHVERVAQDLGYAPNRVAASLRRRRSGVLGLVSDEIATTPFAGRIVLGAQEAVAEAGMTLMVVDSNRRPEVERRQIEVLRAHQVDALLYASMVHRRVAPPAAAASTPMVLVNAVDEAAELSSIGPDEERVGLDATRLLLAAGHRRIAHLTIDEQGLGVDGRIRGYERALAEAGLAPAVVRVPGPADAAAGRAALRRAEEEVAPDAVFAFNDPMAMGVYQQAAAAGLRVPDDLSVVGVDNLELLSAQLLPALTTFELPHYEMGRWAVRRAVSLVDEPGLPPERVRLTCEVFVRNSVALRV